ncbi:MAG: phosphoadenosine phosphosulfate reductase family protein [Tatlockia sp.]|nr:phosphoadenosine phosphosulfate reductase family protein [Tatlockia sp.]
MKQHIIIGNFGNHSLAVMQALIEKSIEGLHFICVETGWAAACWAERVADCANYARDYGVKVHTLKAQSTFSELVRDRRQFPSPKFQWCASFLKGLTIIEHLDSSDPTCEAMIVSGKRQSDSRRYANMQEFDYENDFYQGRTLWYPLWQMADGEFVELIKRTGFPLLPHQSLECSPCIHAKTEDLNQMDSHSLARLEALEQEISQTMYQEAIRSLFNGSTAPRPSEKDKKPDLQQFDRGCGSPWGCGE